MSDRVSVGLVACAATKAATAQPARLLYQSPLFRAASAYCEAVYDHWFVMSAQHYLVHPDEVLEPYDKTLTRMTVADRDHWAGMIESGLRLGYGGLTEGRREWPPRRPRLLLGQWMLADPERRVGLWFHAGHAYTDPILAWLRYRPELAARYEIHLPLAGLGIGQQLAWYRRAGSKHAGDCDADCHASECDCWHPQATLF